MLIITHFARLICMDEAWICIFCQIQKPAPPCENKFYVLHQHVYKAVPKLWIFTIYGLDGSNGFIYVVALMLATAKINKVHVVICLYIIFLYMV